MERRKLSADQQVKIYRGRQAVKGVSLEVEQGSIVGLLGLMALARQRLSI